jgi:hypothetical protein
VVDRDNCHGRKAKTRLFVAVIEVGENESSWWKKKNELGSLV